MKCRYHTGAFKKALAKRAARQLRANGHKVKIKSKRVRVRGTSRVEHQIWICGAR